MSLLDFSFLSSNKDPKNFTFLIILNMEIVPNRLKSLLPLSDIIVSSDGGSNRLYDIKDKVECIPQFLVGDFDSIRPETKLYYESLNSKSIFIYDQNSTDLHKSLNVVLEIQNEMVKNKNIKYDGFNIFVLGCCGGRLDQSYSVYHTIYRFIYENELNMPLTKIFMFSNKTVSVFAKCGRNEVIGHNEKIDLISLSGEITIEPIIDEIREKEINCQFCEVIELKRTSKFEVKNEKPALIVNIKI